MPDFERDPGSLQRKNNPSPAKDQRRINQGVKPAARPNKTVRLIGRKLWLEVNKIESDIENAADRLGKKNRHENEEKAVVGSFHGIPVNAGVSPVRVEG